MSESNDVQSPSASDDRRAELRVPASVLGTIRSRLVGGREFELLNYTAHSLYGQSHTRLLVGSRISVRLATATLNAIVTGRVVRASLTAVTNGVPSYEVAVSLDNPVDWSVELAAAAPVEAAGSAVEPLDPGADRAPAAVPTPA